MYMHACTHTHAHTYARLHTHTHTHKTAHTLYSSHHPPHSHHLFLTILTLHPSPLILFTPPIPSPLPPPSLLTHRTDDEQLRDLQYQRHRTRVKSESRLADRAKSETRLDDRSAARWNKYRSWDREKEGQRTFDSYKKLITPGFYGSKKSMSKSHDELRYCATFNNNNNNSDSDDDSNSEACNVLIST